MTTREFSDQMDTWLDSYKIPDEFGRVENLVSIKLDEYEKSVLLSDAQEMILKNTFQSAFDTSEQGQVYYSNLITIVEGSPVVGEPTYSTNGKLFSLPNNLFWILNERVIDSDGNKYVVKPINYEEYDRISSKPYDKPLKRQAWRLYQGLLNSNSIRSEIILRNDNTINEYLVRYIRKPRPIILENLGDLSINGISTISECELHFIVHQDILKTAVDLAIARYAPNLRPSKQE